MFCDGVEWYEDFDDDDNSIWETYSLYSDEDVQFRLRQKISDNRIVWVNASDEGLVGIPGEEFDTLQDGMLELGRLYKEAMAKHKSDHIREISGRLDWIASHVRVGLALGEDLPAFQRLLDRVCEYHEVPKVVIPEDIED